MHVIVIIIYIYIWQSHPVHTVCAHHFYCYVCVMFMLHAFYFERKLSRWQGDEDDDDDDGDDDDGDAHEAFLEVTLSYLRTIYSSIQNCKGKNF